MYGAVIGALVVLRCRLRGRTEEIASGEKSLNRQYKIAGSLGFQDKSLRTGLANFVFQHFGIMHGEHQNARAKPVFADTPSDFQTAETRHGDV